MNFHYTLTKITDSSYTIDFTESDDIDTEVDDAEVTGTVESHGTLTGDRKNPLAIQADTTVSMDLEISSGDETTDMDVTMDVVSEPTD